MILTRYPTTKRSSSTLALVLAVLLSTCMTHAQVNLNSVSLNAGIIRVLNPYTIDAHGFPFVFYPEIQVGGDLFRPGFQWTVFWGYADDGDQQAGVDYLGGAYSSHAVGIRLEIRPEHLLPHWAIPVGVFAGAGYHAFTFRNPDNRTWVESALSEGPITHEPSAQFVALEAGANLEFHIIGPFALRGEFRQMIPLEHGWPDSMVMERRSVTAGIGYHF